MVAKEKNGKDVFRLFDSVFVVVPIIGQKTLSDIKIGIAFP